MKTITNRFIVNFGAGCLVLLISSFFLIGCGDDSSSSSLPGPAPECFEGYGECEGAQMCKNSRCVPIQGQRFRFTVETGQFPEADNYYLRVRDRGDSLLMETSVSSNTRTPSWYESTTVTVQNMTDWWMFQLRSEGFFMDGNEYYCQIDFEPREFEVDGRYTCGNGSSDQFVFRIAPL